MFDVPDRLETVIARGAEGFGIAVLHAGEAFAFLSPQEAERVGRKFLKLAAVARRPGQCPELGG